MSDNPTNLAHLIGTRDYSSAACPRAMGFRRLGRRPQFRLVAEKEAWWAHQKSCTSSRRGGQARHGLLVMALLICQKSLRVSVGRKPKVLVHRKLLLGLLFPGPTWTFQPDTISRAG